MFDRFDVVVPSRTIAKVLVGKLPSLERVGQPILEADDLLFRADVQEDFDQPDAIKPALFNDTQLVNGGFTTTLPAKSIVALEFK